MKYIYKNRTDFVKNIIVLISGTTLAQAIPILISPFLTRIYSPENFGVLGLFVSMSSFLGVIISLRYDSAIIQADNDAEAKQLGVVAFISSLFFSVLLFLVVLFFNDSISSLFDNKKIGNWLYFLPLTVLSISLFYILSFWLNRKKRFVEMSVNKIVNKSSESFISLLLGVLNFKSIGLLFGYIFGQFITTLLLLNKVRKDKFRIKPLLAKKVIKKYKEFPVYFLPSTIMSEVSSNVSLLLMGSLYGATFTGFYALVFRVTYLPLGLVGNSIGDVYRQKAYEHYLEFGNCKELFLKTFKTLFLIGLAPLVALLFMGEYLFTFVFGSEWETAGTISKYFSFLIFFQFISTPLAYTVFLNKSHKFDFILQFLRAVFTIFSLFTGYYYNDFMLGILLMVIVYCSYYILNSLLQYNAATGSKYFKTK